MSTEMNNSANSICIPRAFANITEARVRKIFDALNIFVIDRVDMIQRKNEKGEAFQRIFVHIREWSETADAQKAKARLVSGNELKIVYDDPWFWKVALNSWTPKPAPNPSSLYDRKPKIRIEFGEDAANVDAAAALLGSLDLGAEDRRPYRERRSDPVYCAQDRDQGFHDRRPRDDDRRPRDDDRSTRFTDRSPVRDDRRDGRRFKEDHKEPSRRFKEDRSQRRDQEFKEPSRRFKEEPSQRRDQEFKEPSRRFKEDQGQRSARDCRRHRDDEQLLANTGILEPRTPSSSPPRRSEKTVLPPANSIAPALPEIKPKPVEVVKPAVKPVEVVKPAVKPAVKPVERDPGLNIRMQHAFQCEITDEIYLANRQSVRDQMETERSRPLQFGEVANNETPDYKNEDGTAIVAPKKKGRKVILDEQVEDK